MSEKCRAVVFNGDGTFNIKIFDKPAAPDGGAVLKVEAVGMCSSDVGQLNGHKHVPGEAAPVVAGHEIVGRIEQLAENADLGVAVGDRVAVNLVLPGQPAGKFVVYGYTMGVDEGSGLWGGYGEYMSILAGTHLIKLTEAVPATHLTIFEPLANAVNWVEQAGVAQGDTVVIQGPGHVGLMCVAAAKIAGASNIIVIGTSADTLRLEAARAAGAGHTIMVDKEDAIARVRDLTGGYGADKVMEITAMSTDAVKQTFDMVKFGGTILLAGLKNMAPTEIVTDRIVLNDLTIRGGAGSTPDSMNTAVRYLNEGLVNTEALLGEVFPLDGFEEAMALLKREHPDRDAIRVTIAHQ